MSSFVPSAITQPFFELQTTDFVWKFIWTVQPSDKVQKYKKYKNPKTKKRKKAKNAKKFKFKNVKRTKGTKVKNFFNLKLG